MKVLLRQSNSEAHGFQHYTCYTARKIQKHRNKGWMTKDKIWNNEAKIVPSGTNRCLKLNLVM